MAIQSVGASRIYGAGLWLGMANHWEFPLQTQDMQDRLYLSPLALKQLWILLWEELKSVSWEQEVWFVLLSQLLVLDKAWGRKWVDRWIMCQNQLRDATCYKVNIKGCRTSTYHFTCRYFAERNGRAPFAEHNPFLYKVTCPFQIPLLELEGTQENAAANITLGNAQTSSTFLTFPLNPLRLLSDGREYTSVFRASVCGSIRICKGNPHPDRQVCSLRQLEFIYPLNKRSLGVWILCCRLVVGSRLAMASPRNRWSLFFNIFPWIHIHPGVKIK